MLLTKQTALHCHKMDGLMDFMRIRSRNLFMDFDRCSYNLRYFLNILRLSEVRSVVIRNYPFHEDGIFQLHSSMKILGKKVYLKKLHCTASKSAPEVINFKKGIEISSESFSNVESLAVSHLGEVFSPYLQLFTKIKALRIRDSKTQRDYEAIIHLIKLNQRTLVDIELETCANLSFKVIISIMNLEVIRKLSLKHCNGAYMIVSKLLDKYGNSNLLEYFDIENYQYEGFNHYGSVHHHIIK